MADHFKVNRFFFFKGLLLMTFFFLLSCKDDPFDPNLLHKTFACTLTATIDEFEIDGDNSEYIGSREFTYPVSVVFLPEDIYGYPTFSFDIVPEFEADSQGFLNFTHVRFNKSEQNGMQSEELWNMSYKNYHISGSLEENHTIGQALSNYIILNKTVAGILLNNQKVVFKKGATLRSNINEQFIDMEIKAQSLDQKYLIDLVIEMQ